MSNVMMMNNKTDTKPKHHHILYTIQVMPFIIVDKESYEYTPSTRHHKTTQTVTSRALGKPRSRAPFRHAG